MDDGDALRAVPGLVDVALQGTGERWTRFPLGVTAEHLVIEWTPSGEQGPREIPFWNAGAPTRSLAEAELADRVPCRTSRGRSRSIPPPSKGIADGAAHERQLHL